MRQLLFPPRAGRTHRTDYRDLLVMLGPNVRYVECDAEDLQHDYPEVFLGYRVMLLPGASPTDIWRQLRGRRISKIVVVGEDQMHPRTVKEITTVAAIAGSKIEFWDVWRNGNPRCRLVDRMDLS